MQRAGHLLTRIPDDHMLHRVEPWSLEQAASLHTWFGERVRWVDGIPWHEHARGFWRPVAFMQPFPGTVVRAPRPALGYHTLVDPRIANSRLIYRLVDDLPHYGMHRVGSSRRAGLRKALRTTQCVVIDDPGILLDQGWDVAVSAHNRTGQRLVGPRERFQSVLQQRWQSGSGLVVAGLKDGRLGAFTLMHALGRDVYIEDTYIADWARPWNVGIAVYWHAFNVLAHEGQFDRAWFGLVEPTLPHLAAHKQGLGSRLRALPARVHLARPAAWYLRHRKRLAHQLLGCAEVGGPS